MVTKIRNTAGSIDKGLLISWLMLVGFGLIMIASASSIKAHNEFVTSSGKANDYWYITRQATWIGVSIIALSFFAHFDYRKLRYFAFPVLVIVIGLLAAVFLPIIGGQETLGARRWLNFGLLGMQPSELTKLALAVYLATWLERKGKEVSDFKYGFLPFAILIGLIILLLYFQKDLGTTIIISIMAFSVFFVSGANIFQLLMGSLVGLAVVFVLIQTTPFRVGRIEAWLDPYQSPTKIGYHVIQAELTVGSGGIFGVGYGHSLQKYEYIPHAPTDSIFAIIAEELGLVGALSLIGLYFFLLSRIYVIAARAQDNFGRLLAIAVGVWIASQAFINMGGLLRVIPLTGIPLPFISYGGSSMLSLSIGVGMVLGISRYMNGNPSTHANRTHGRGNGRSRRSSNRLTRGA